jgi:hypothetical protein
MDERVKRIGIVAAAGIVLAVFAYTGYGVYQKRGLRAQVVDAVAKASRQLDEALVIDLLAPSAPDVQRIDAGVARSEELLQQLRALTARRDPELVEAADPYVASVLEVQRRQAGAVRHRARFIEDRDALNQHMALVGTRSENWAAEAIRLKKKLEQDNYDYQLTVVSLGNMLAGLLDARRKIAAQLPAVPLPEEAVLVQARERSLAAAGTAKQEFENARRLVPPG